MVQKGGIMSSYKVVNILPPTGNSDTIYLVPNKEMGRYDEYYFYSGNKPIFMGSYFPGEEQEIEDVPYAATCRNCAATVEPGQKCEYCGTVHMTYIRRKKL